MIHELTPNQQEIADDIVRRIESGETGFCVLHGLAGTGKTEVLAWLWRRFPWMLVCATTHKAAINLSKRIEGCHCQTLHSAIYKPIVVRCPECKGESTAWDETSDCRHCEGKGCEVCDGVGQKTKRVSDCDYCEGTGKDPKKLFFRLKDNLKTPRVIAVDECSMIDTSIAADMEELEGVFWIIVGDPGQLPPVKGQQAFTEYDYMLTEILRQGPGSGIVKQAHRVRAGLDYHPDGPEFRVTKALDYHDVFENHNLVIARTNDEVSMLNKARRRMLGFHPEVLKPGEPLICIQTKKLLGLFNGMLYEFVRRRFKKNEKLGTVDSFLTVRADDGREITASNVNILDLDKDVNPDSEYCWFRLAYAVTAHRSQGCEWDRVYVVDTRGDGMDKTELHQWRYTAITRAKEGVTICDEWRRKTGGVRMSQNKIPYIPGLDMDPNEQLWGTRLKR